MSLRAYFVDPHWVPPAAPDMAVPSHESVLSTSAVDGGETVPLMNNPHAFASFARQYDDRLAMQGVASQFMQLHGQPPAEDGLSGLYGHASNYHPSMLQFGGATSAQIPYSSYHTSLPSGSSLSLSSMYPYATGMATDRASRHQFLLSMQEQERLIHEQRMQLLMQLERRRNSSSNSTSSTTNRLLLAVAAAAAFPPVAGDGHGRTIIGHRMRETPPDDWCTTPSVLANEDAILQNSRQTVPQEPVEGDLAKKRRPLHVDGSDHEDVPNAVHDNGNNADDDAIEETVVNQDNNTDPPREDNPIRGRRKKKRKSTNTNHLMIDGATDVGTPTGDDNARRVAQASPTTPAFTVQNSSLSPPPPPPSEPTQIPVPDTVGSNCPRPDLMDSNKLDDIIGRRNQTLRLARSLPFDKKYYVLGRLFEEMSEKEKVDIQKLLEQV